MKSQSKVKKMLLLATLALSTVVVLGAPSAVLAATYAGTTVLTFSVNPATLSGDSAADVTITTTTTSSGGATLISEGKVKIELATDGTVLDGDLNPIGGNPVPAAEVVYWMALNAPGVNPDGSGVTTLDVDLDALGFLCGTVGGFRAHYVTGGGKDKVDTHFSEAVDLTAVCNCEWIGETAWAAGARYQNPGNWATYTAYDGAAKDVDLLAGQTMVAGTVHFSAPVAGYVTITISLNADWRFYDDPENVKIQDYATAPSGNPSPGDFARKDYATGSSFNIVVPENNFYGVHVDVEQEVCE